MARDLGEEEKKLWRKVVESITPLSKSKIAQISSPQPVAVQSNSDKSPKIAAQSAKSQVKQEAQSLNPTRADLAAALSRPITASPLIRRSNRLTNQDALRASEKSAHNGLDGHWEKRFNKGVIIPDLSIDLHGAGLQSAYDRLDGALEQARAQKLRVILLVTGRQRQYDRASGQGRGGIRAVMSDWLSASRHSEYIASVRNAHPRHGGAGALYIILRK